MRAAPSALAAAILVVAGCTASSVGESPRATDPPPSILLLTVDTLRADRVAPAPRGQELAPFLASLAAGSTVFTAAHSTSSWTVPAAATLATGLYPHSHGVTVGLLQAGGVIAQPVIPEGVPRLATALAAAGYRTYAVLANGHMAADLGFAPGFDRFACVGFAPAEEVLAALEPWRAEIAGGESPFFLWLHFFDPHFPYRPREPWFSALAPDVTEAEREVLARAEATWPEMPPEVFARPRRYLDIARSLYDSEVAALDHTLAGLFRSLPVLDDALIIFTADHGEEFQEHGRIGHGHNLFAPTVQVPLWVRPPGGGAGSVDTRVASLVDVPPTILDAAGLEPPAAWPGLSLLAPAAADRQVLAQLAKVPTRRLEALIGERFKLVRTEPGGRSELYDLAADLGEQRDLSAAAGAELQRQEILLAELLASLPGPTDMPPPRPVSDEERRRLEALGYAEPTR